MLYSLTTLRRLPVRAGEREIGSLQDLFFDDLSTLIRYLLIDTGGLNGRRVPVPPRAFGQVRADDGVLVGDIDPAAIESCPAFGEELPLSREEEARLHEHFGWQPYWTAVPPAVGGAVPFWGWMARPEPGEAAPSAADDPEVSASVRPREDGRLQSARDVSGYRVIASDGEVGKISDFIVDDAQWAIAYLVVEAGGGRPVLIAPTWLKRVHWDERRADCEVTCVQVESSPAYDPAVPLEAEYQQTLAAHYGQPFGTRAGSW